MISTRPSLFVTNMMTFSTKLGLALFTIDSDVFPWDRTVTTEVMALIGTRDGGVDIGALSQLAP